MGAPAGGRTSEGNDVDRVPLSRKWSKKTVKWIQQNKKWGGTTWGLGVLLPVQTRALKKREKKGFSGLLLDTIREALPGREQKAGNRTVRYSLSPQQAVGEGIDTSQRLRQGRNLHSGHSIKGTKMFRYAFQGEDEARGLRKGDERWGDARKTPQRYE